MNNNFANNQFIIPAAGAAPAPILPVVAVLPALAGAPVAPAGILLAHAGFPVAGARAPPAPAGFPIQAAPAVIPGQAGPPPTAH